MTWSCDVTLFSIVGLYVALNLMILLWLSVQVIRNRIKHKVIMGGGDNRELNRWVRAQGNFVEYTPMALIGLFMLASLNALPIVLHILGAGWVLGRILHAHGITRDNALGLGRRLGIVLTLLVFFATIIYLLALIFLG